MHIYLDIDRAINSKGQALLYYGSVHWDLDDKDTVSTDDVKKLAASVQLVFDNWLKEKANNDKR